VTVCHRRSPVVSINEANLRRTLLARFIGVGAEGELHPIAPSHLFPCWQFANAASENATIWDAFQQLQTYQAEVPSLLAANALMVASDGVQARVGAVGAGREWFKPWRTIAGEELADTHLPELQVVIEGLCAKRRFLDLVRDFIVFEDDGGGHIVKKMAGYHQFHAVQVAVAETLRAAELARAQGVGEGGRKHGGKPGDRRVGVVWHTQGSGKSLTMARG
jgi:type I restriction enzyme R subunit